MPAPENSKRCTLTDIAKVTGLSTSTVSLAMRDDSRILKSTRFRVQQIAKEMGYQRDPLISKLMTHLRNGRPATHRGVIIALFHEPYLSEYVQRLLKAADKEAKRLGYSLNLQRIERSFDKQSRLDFSLRHRGIEGLIILPSDLPLDLSQAMNWERYSVVSAGHNPIAPRFNAVSSNWFQAIKLCSSKLRAKGHSRLGFILGIHWNYLSKEFVQGALGTEISQRSKDYIPPLYYRSTQELPASVFIHKRYLEYLSSDPIHPATGEHIHTLEKSIMPWFRSHKPDILVLDRDETIAPILTLFARFKELPPPIAVISRSPTSGRPGTELPATEVGTLSVGLLDHQIRQGSTGIPELNMNILLDGRWKDPDMEDNDDKGRSSTERTTSIG